LDDELIAEFIARVVQESFPAKAWRRAAGSLHIKLRGQAHTPERMQHGPSPGGPNCRCSQYGAARFSFTAENGRKSITRACRQTGVTPAGPRHRPAGRIARDAYGAEVLSVDDKILRKLREEQQRRADNRGLIERMMREIFAECRHVLKPDGLLTMMFMHKEQGAWETLTKALIESGWDITAAFPVQSEGANSIHQVNGS
jgi:hypothetical protein